MKLTLLNAERTTKGTSVALKLSNGKKIVVGNTIINKPLSTSLLSFATFAALVAVGGYDIDIPGDVVAHVAGEPHNDGHFRTDGFHMELEEDQFPMIELANSPIAIGLMFQLPQNREAILLPVKVTASGADTIAPNAEFAPPSAEEAPEASEAPKNAKTTNTAAKPKG